MPSFVLYVMRSTMLNKGHYHHQLSAGAPQALWTLMRPASTTLALNCRSPRIFSSTSDTVRTVTVAASDSDSHPRGRPSGPSTTHKMRICLREAITATVATDLAHQNYGVLSWVFWYICRPPDVEGAMSLGIALTLIHPRVLGHCHTSPSSRRGDA